MFDKWFKDEKSFLMICLLAMLIFFTLVSVLLKVAHGEQKFNPFTNRWETVYPDAKIRWNPYDDTWRYVSPPPPTQQQQERNWYEKEPKPEFNPFNNKWEWPK